MMASPTPIQAEATSNNHTSHDTLHPYIVLVDSAYIPTLSNEEFQSVAATASTSI